jgi:hypothetical protein
MIAKDLSTTDKDILLLFSSHYKVTISRDVSQVPGDSESVCIRVEDKRDGSETTYTLGQP